MTLDEIIELFERIEEGEAPSVGYHLHECIRKTQKTTWPIHNKTEFSYFLHALKEHEPIER